MANSNASRNGTGAGHKPSVGDTRSDEELIAELVERNEEALKPLHARYAPLIFHMASQALDTTTAEEIVQDVFLAVWRKADTFDPSRGAFRPWLLQIAHFRILNELRRRSRRPPLAEDIDGDLSEELSDESAEPVETAWHAYRRDAIRAAVANLPPHQRQALSLAFFEDLTHDQVADTLKLPLGTVKTRIRSAMHTLRNNLAPLGIAALLIGLLGLLGIRYQAQEQAYLRDQAALLMVTLSDSTAIHVPPAPGVPPETHGSYRSRVGTPVAVLALHNFTAAPQGKTYQGWVLHQGMWISLGTVLPDANGNAVLIAENTGLAVAPEAIQVTLEPAGGSPAPTGQIVITWSNQ